MPDTPATPLRTLIEQRRDAHSSANPMNPHCQTCGAYKPWPCPDRVAAEAELACIAELQAHLEAADSLLEFGHDLVNGSWTVPPNEADVHQAGACVHHALALIAPPTGKEDS